jgi:D-xylose transport system substrate-binding protein
LSIRRTAVALTVLTIILAACQPSSSGSPSGSAAGSEPAASGGSAADCHVGVSWATFQEERYGLRDEPGIEGVLQAAGAEYTGNDAANSNETQASNIEALLAAGIDVLVLNSVDPTAVLPALQTALDAGIPVIAYDRELESEDVLFMTHDNVEVGRMIARAVTEAQPTGNYAIIKGQEGQTNPEFLRQGMAEIIDPLIEAGDITIPEGAEVYTDEWLPDNAQDNMETILTATNNDIQAVLSENDGMATGVTAALDAQGLVGQVKIGGQDGDVAALNRVALGTQVVSVWKDATELGAAAGVAALALCDDPDVANVTGAEPTTTTGGLNSYALFLDPVPITQDNLQVVLDADWLTEDELCAGVTAGSVEGCP